ncbi:unnamed protein product [Orchesella dallaii]|uniref:Uncharacterized protein n=1 Tax=Orchesella dallaii TaxID=48710 RepID=A0ABP1RQK7_9HEXA
MASFSLTWAKACKEKHGQKVTNSRTAYSEMGHTIDARIMGGGGHFINIINSLEGVDQNLLEVQKQILRYKGIVSVTEVVEKDQFQQLYLSLTEMKTDLCSLSARLEYVRGWLSRLSLE